MIREWIDRIFPWVNRKTGKLEFNECFIVQAEIYYKLLAIETAINLIANTMSLAEFKTFKKGINVKENNFYLFNIEPNLNQNANRFWRQAVHNMVYDNECLIVMQDDQLFVADSFERKEFAFYPNRYTNVKIENLILDKTYEEKDVLYLNLHSERMKNLIDGLYADYGRLIEYSKGTYKRSNAKRGILKIPTNYPKTVEASTNLERLLNEQFKNFFNAENGALLPLTNGLEYTDLTNQTYKNGSDSRDIRNLIDDVFDYVAIAFQIPPQLLKGAVADSDKSFDNFMVFCIRPWLELIEKEINRKFYRKKEFCEKSFVSIDISMIKQNSILDMANAIDILTRNGVNTLNDNLKLLGRQQENSEIGEQRFMTLNLSKMEDIISGNVQKGGGNGEQRED